MIIDESGWPTLEVSPLFNVEPLGIGTPFVESLSSYVARLAAAHLITVSALAKDMIAPLLSKVCLHPDNVLIGSRNSVCAINGNNQLTEEWVAALEQLTSRNDLRKLTLLPLANLFTDKVAMKQGRRWCPRCLDEWKKDDQVLYEPLLWYINTIKICPLHEERLIDDCPHCGCASLPLAPRAFPGYCCHCEGWLGHTTNVPVGVRSKPYSMWAATEVGQLLVSGAMGHEAINGTIPALLDFLIKKRSKRNGIISTARLIKVKVSKLRKWQNGEARPDLHELLFLCWIFKLKLKDLETQAICWEDYGGFDERVAEEMYNDSRNQSKTDWLKIEKQLDDIVKGNVAPQRIVDIARANDCQASAIYGRYSDLCKVITTKYFRNNPL